MGETHSPLFSMRKRKTKKAVPRNDTSFKAKKVAKKKKTQRANASPKTRNGGTMTEAQFFQRLRHSLRKTFRWWKPMLDALKAASRPSQSANKRLKIEYQCAECKQWFPRTQVQIDHKIPCGPLNCYEDVVPFIRNLVVEDVSAFQILCKKDHAIKTEQEKLERKNNKI